MRGTGFDASEDGTGRGVPLVPAISPALKARDHKGPSSDGDGDGAPLIPVAFHATQDPISGAISPALSRTGVIAIQERAVADTNCGPQGKGWQEDLAYTLEARNRTQYAAYQLGVRRLTPRECERLQGFPGDWTLVPYRGKPAADGPRIQAIGNSMAVPCMRWIGERIVKVDAIEVVTDKRRSA